MFDLGHERLRQRAIQSRTTADHLLAELAGFKAGQPLDPQLRLLLEPLFSEPAEVARQALRNAAVGLTFVQIGDTMQTTSQELVETTGIDAGRVEAFLALFSTTFGRTESTLALVGGHDLRKHPIIADDAGNYLCSYPGNLLFVLRSRLEHSLKPNDQTHTERNRWERYNRARKNHVESEAVRLLAETLRGTSWTNLTYTIDGQGPYELDGLIALDTVAFVVEAKAAALSPPARHGLTPRLRRDVTETLEHATVQANRLREAFRAGDEVQFMERGSPIDFSLDEVSRVFPIVITLDDFSGVSPTIWELIEAELIDFEGDPPWIVSLHELEIVTDLMEFSAMLPHYLTRRERLNQIKLVRAADELDFFMHYLESGLYFERLLVGEERIDAIFIASLTDAIDAYYFWINGLRTKAAAKPQQRMHAHFKALVRALDTERPFGFLEASIALLDMDDEGRKTFAQRFRKMKRQSATDKRWHDMTLSFVPNHGYGITAMTSPPKGANVLSERLAVYCSLKKHQMGADAWVGLGGAPGGHEVDALVILRQPWEPDDDLESLVRDTFEAEPDLEQVSVKRREWLQAELHIGGEGSN